MPRRRRGQEPARAARRIQRRVANPRVQTWEQTLDSTWAEHRADEAVRRSTPLVVPPRPKPFDIRPVVASVLADFARWEAERSGR